MSRHFRLRHFRLRQFRLRRFRLRQKNKGGWVGWIFCSVTIIVLSIRCFQKKLRKNFLMFKHKEIFCRKWYIELEQHHFSSFGALFCYVAVTLNREFLEKSDLRSDLLGYKKISDLRDLGGTVKHVATCKHGKNRAANVESSNNSKIIPK